MTDDEPPRHAREFSLDGLTVLPFGDAAIVILLGDVITIEAHHRVQTVTQILESAAPKGMVECIPAFTTVTVVYDYLAISYDAFAQDVRRLLASRSDARIVRTSRLFEIPVCYGGELGPDLDFVASHNGLTAAEVITLHTQEDYLVYMIGFAPGFAYLGGMSDRIATPRRSSPRNKIPRGSVAIADRQTGVYPIETPGGWQLIGRTPLAFFRPDQKQPSLLQTGDRVRFESVDREHFDELARAAAP